MQLFSRLVFAISAAVAQGAALAPVPTPPQPSIPAAGLEPNKGQANSGILFLTRGNGGSAAVTAQSILYSPLGTSLNLIASFSDPLPGQVNSYTGGNPRQWVTGITRYTTAKLTAVFPGIDAQYTIDPGGVLTLNLLLAAGIDPKALQFQIAGAASLTLPGDGSLIASIGSTGEFAPTLSYPAPAASQSSGIGQVSRSVKFAVQSTTTFGLQVQGLDPTQPLQVSIQVSGASAGPLVSGSVSASDAAGNAFVAANIVDAAGSCSFPRHRQRRVWERHRSTNPLFGCCSIWVLRGWNA